MDSEIEKLAKQLNSLFQRAESAGKVRTENPEISTVVFSQLVSYDTLLGSDGYCAVCGRKLGAFVPDFDQPLQGRRQRSPLSISCPHCHATFRFSFSSAEE